MEAICILQFDPGNCDAIVDVWTFDATTQRCREEIWGGCGGNDNRFQSERQCRDTCAH